MADDKKIDFETEKGDIKLPEVQTRLTDAHNQINTMEALKLVIEKVDKLEARVKVLEGTSK